MSLGPLPDLEGLPGLNPAWSQVVPVPDRDGAEHRWHVLDNGADPVHGTVLCVHGNPTWSFLWRRFLAQAPDGWRVVAPDQLGMGFSERLDRPRRFAERVADLGALTSALSVTGPVVLVAHDWGGPIGLGWALEHRDQLAGLVLGNTGVGLPAGASLPWLLRTARTPALRNLVCVWTRTFVRGAAALSRPRLPRDVRQGLARPYRHAADRAAIGDFVADIPVGPDHPTRPAWDAMAARVETLYVPALLLWGPRDPVFTTAQLEDLRQRLPHSDVHRYARASHLVTEDAPDTASDAWQWIADLMADPAEGLAEPTWQPEVGPSARAPSLDEGLRERGDDPATAVAELHAGQATRTSFAELEQRVRDLAAGLAADGVRPGDRVVLLVPPGVDLTVAVYACWRAGAAIVVADAGLGVRGMAHALRSAGPDHLIGVPQALLAVAALRVPGHRIATTRLPELASTGRGRPQPEVPGGDPEAAVLFTSGATGPAKGVVYRRSQLRAQLDQVQTGLGLRPEDRLVAAFAPFALYGPALGLAAAVPDMSVTAPGTLTAQALADAVQAVEATVVFASPVALRNVVATAGGLTGRQREALNGIRLLLSFGAPVPASLLRDVQGVLPAAELHTPYGMTEVLPVADISLAQIEAAGPGNGVCVGRPLPGVALRISPLDQLGRAEGGLTDEPEVTGEICVAAAHVKDHYDQLWATERRSARNPGWHRSGDVGHLDGDGRLWVEGRLVHVVVTADGPVTPVGLEQRVETLPEVQAAAVVGVGPVGTQQVVVVTVPATRTTRRRVRSGLAAPELARAVRDVAGEQPIAAVLTTDRLPVDIRHASKVDRVRVARWAGRLLAGERAGRL